MRIDVLTLFPGMFAGPFSEGMVRKAVEAGLCEVRLHDLRAWAPPPHRVVDDAVFGGGPGMLLKPEPIVAAWESLCAQGAGRLVYLSPQGRRLDQPLAGALAREPALTLLCGRYEGVDERVLDLLRPLEVSIGDYVLTGGELPAMVLIDAVVRLLPGVLAAGAAEVDSFATGLLEGPQYTRPRVFRGLEVPDVLLGGHHGEIARWRRREALRRTWRRRPELLWARPLLAADRRLLAEVLDEVGPDPRAPGDGRGPASGSPAPGAGDAGDAAPGQG